MIRVVGVDSFLMFIYPCIEFGVYELDEMIVFNTLKTFRKICDLPLETELEIL
jgi:hypothetical protein